jgi:NAD(P)-dependent dehydrogenase (short-subunit alcohol dehydrogenase family)
MRENGRGKIINISFSSAVNGMPTMGAFTASTAALESATETLWYELKPFGINVSVVRSAYVNADHQYPITTSTKAKMAEVLMGPYSDYYRFIRPLLQRFIAPKDGNYLNLINAILFAIKTQNPPLWIHDSMRASLFSMARSFLPTTLYFGLVNFLFTRHRRLGVKYSRAQKRRLVA